MDTKGLRVEIKDQDQGLVTAVFSTFNVVDSDGDVTLPGAFTDGAEVRISAYGHKSWEGLLPVGKGVIRTTSTEAILDGEFFLDTIAGADTFKTVKRMGALQEWSYGYDPVEYSFGDFEGRHVRFLAKQQVHEVSPVLLGAGVGTRTLSAKSATGTQRRGRALAPHETAVSAGVWDGAKTLSGIASDARPSELRTIYAWVDPDADPEIKDSYKFPHHQGIKGPANVRACLIGIALLNGARGETGLSDTDRKGAYEHLAAHLRDADREVPELRAQPGGPMKFAEELLEGLAGLSDLLDSASRVVALRAEKGKGLSKVNAEILGWIDSDLNRLKSLLTTPVGPEEPSGAEIASLFARSVAQLNEL